MFGLSGDKQFISLDWDSRSLRVVQWRASKHQVRALKSLSAELPDDVAVKDAESMGQFLRAVLSRERIRTRSVIVDIPRDQAVLNSMSLPAVDLSDLAGMVQLQIAKELPFPLDDAVVDFAVTEHDDSAESADVLVAAVRHDVLHFYQAVCAHADLKLDRVGLRPYANMVAVNEMLGAQATGRVMFIDIGPALTEIGILREGTLVFSRAASVSLDEDQGDSFDERLDTLLDSETEDTAEQSAETVIEIDSPAALDNEPQPSLDDRILDELMVEITRSTEAYRSTDPGARFDHVIVGGSSGLEDRLAARVTKRFGVAAKTYNPETQLKPAKHRGAGLTAFAAAVGLGLGHATEGKLQFDFLAPKKPLDAAARRRRQLPRVAAMIAALALFGGAAYAVGIHPKKGRIAELETEVAALDKQLDTFKKVSDIVKQVEAWEQSQLVWPDALKKLSEVFPDNEQAYLEDLDLNAPKNEISFRILAANRQVVDDLISRLSEFTRPGGKKGEKLPQFKVGTSQISSTGRDPKYRTATRVTITSSRVDELKSKGRPGSNKRSRPSKNRASG